MLVVVLIVFESELLIVIRPFVKNKDSVFDRVLCCCRFGNTYGVYIAYPIGADWFVRYFRWVGFCDLPRKKMMH